jgi:hypothetical protein
MQLRTYLVSGEFRVHLTFAERSWCKHRADLGFYVDDMYVTSAEQARG